VDKAPDAFRTISEVADDLDVPQHVLRFWETRFPQIRPMKRGGGRRYYRPDDVELLRGIRHLLYGEGYTIRGVQGQIKEKGLKFVQGVWKQEAPASNRAVESETDDGESAAGLRVTRAATKPAAPPEPDDDDEDETAATPRPRVTVGLVAGPRPSPPRPQQTSAAKPVLQAPAAAGLGAEDRQRLQTVLSELAECRRILDAVLKDAE
jgi:DNA-binding transcriptional MerR regulator